jgi:hypothetical protein
MKTFLIILLNLMGILVCFITKYGNRRKKEQAFNLLFWWLDNWPELTATMLVDVALLIIYLTGDLKIDASSFLPDWVGSIGSLTVSFALGLGLAALIYEVFKSKVKRVKKEITQ